MKKILLIVLLLTTSVFGAGRYIYVDGTASGGGNTGTTAAPLEGAAGLQRALRQAETGGPHTLGVNNGDTEDIVIFLRNTVTTAATITLDANAPSTTGAHKFLIGCTGTGETWTPITALGTYVIVQATGNDLAGSPIFSLTDNCSNVIFKNIYAYDNDEGGLATNDDGFQFVGTANQYGVVMYNCKATHVQKAFNNTSTRYQHLQLINCVGNNCNNEAIEATSAIIIRGGVFDASNGGFDLNADSTVSNVVILNGDTALDCASASEITVENCAFIGQTTQGILANNASLVLSVRNCIFDVADTVNDKGITLTSGYLWEQGNISNTTAGNSGFITYSGSTAGLTFTNTDPFTSITGANYALNVGQTICDTYALDLGIIPYLGASTSGNKVSIGPYQLTQTQSGGGATDSGWNIGFQN